MLTTWDPFRDVERLFEVDPRTRSIPAPFDAVRTSDEVVLTYDLPGFRADDVDVTVENHVLTLTCLLYTSDAADDLPWVALGGRRII